MTDPRADTPLSDDDPAPHPRVLVVDDDAASRRLLLRSLDAMGYATEGAGDGSQALEMIVAQPPEIVLLDLDLPGMNGAEVCTRLRHHQREEVRNIPVVMLTAHDGEREEVACLAAGANDFISKPIGRAALAARIATQLRLRALNETLRLQNEELERWRAAQIADLDAAQLVQRAILPADEAIPGWKMEVGFSPIIQVGGDIYGVETTREGRLVWLADATGHGVAAALCTTLVALLFQRAATLSDPGKVLAQVNAGMLRIFHGGSIMSAVCAMLLPDGELRFAGAGHPPLLVRRADGRVESIASQSTVLGVLPDLTFPMDVLNLAVGDVALFLTDGLYSARRPDGKRIEIEEVAPAFALGEKLSALIDRMRGKSAFDDDATAISIQRTV
ncbi:MAG: SpoIIE family protein phosphatase [Chthoniobacteraceae bacterium]